MTGSETKRLLVVTEVVGRCMTDERERPRETLLTLLSMLCRDDRRERETLSGLLSLLGLNEGETLLVLLSLLVSR